MPICTQHERGRSLPDWSVVGKNVEVKLSLPTPSNVDPMPTWTDAVLAGEGSAPICREKVKAALPGVALIGLAIVDVMPRGPWAS